MAGEIHRGVIEVVVDASGVTAGVEQAKASLKGLEGAAANAGSKIGSGLASGTGQAGKATEHLDAVTRRFLTTLERESLQAGRTRSEYLELRAAKLGVADSTGAMIARIREAEKGVQRMGLSAKQTTAALRQVPAQFTDIIVSLQGGQSPLQVLLQQGGQLKDVFGGIGPAAQALGRYVLGLVNPYTLAAAAAVGLAVAYKEASDEGDAFVKALALTNNAAGTTVSQLNGMAEAIDNIVGTQSAAAEGLAAFAATGQVAGKDLQQFTVTALRLKEVAGTAVEETVKQFAELGRAPVEASLKFNQSMRYLTLATLDQIKALVELGRTNEAGAVAQQAFDRAVNEGINQMRDNLGPLQQAWIDFKNVINETGDALVNLFRKGSFDNQIAQLQKNIERARAPTNFGLFESDARDMEQQVQILQRRQYAEQNATEAAKARTDNAQRTLTVAEKVDAANKRALTTQQKTNAELKEYRDNIEFLRKQPPTPEVLKRLDPKVIAQTEASILNPRKSGGGARSSPIEIDTGKSDLEAQLAETKRFLDSLTGAYRNSESLLEAVRSAGLVSEGEYYEAKRAFIRLNADAQDNALVDQIAALELDIDRLEQKKLGLKGNDATRVEREIIDANRKVADAEEKRVQATANATTQIELLNTRQASSIAALTRSYEEARIAAEQYLSSLTLQQQREIDALGTGRRGRDQAAGRNQITDRYQGQREQLEAGKRLLEFEGKFTEEARAQYEKRLSIIDEFNAKALASFDAYYAQRLEKERSFNTGASDALNDYLDSVKNVASETERLFGKAFSGLEDALVDFTKTGRLNFKSLAQGITDDLNRTIIRQNITGPLAEWLQGGLKTGEGVSGSIVGGIGTLLGDGKDKGAASATLGFQSLKTLGIDPATQALMRFTQAANGAAGGGAQTPQEFSLDGTFTGEGAVKSLFEQPAEDMGATLVDTRNGTQAFLDVLKPASVALSGIGPAGTAAAFALQLLPSIIQSMQGSSSGGGIGSLLSFGASLFGSPNAAGGANAAGFGTGAGFGNLDIGGFLASGGPAEFGKAYVVGEQGRELFIPRTSGTVIPAQQTEKIMRGGSTLNQHFYVTGAVNKRTQGQLFSDAARGATMARARGTA